MSPSKKFSLKDWFFNAIAPRLPAKSAEQKVRRTFSLPKAEYSKIGGQTRRIQPRRFRRGRAWKGGKLVRPERFKFWTLK